MSLVMLRNELILVWGRGGEGWFYVLVLFTNKLLRKNLNVKTSYVCI